MKTLRNTVIATTMLGMLAGTAMQATAGDTTEIFGASLATKVEKTVNISDLNLNSAQGQEVLHRRLSRAAAQICGATDYRRAGGLAQASRNKQCAEQALARSLSKVYASSVASTN